MKKRYLVVLLLLGLIAMAGKIISHKPVPRGILIPVSHGKMELYNTGSEPLYYHGLTRHDTVFKIDIDPFPPKSASNESVCGDGLILHRLEPGNSVQLRVYLPYAAYKGKEIIVSCNLFGPVSRWELLKEKIREHWPASFEPSPDEKSRSVVKVKTDKYLPKRS